VTPEQFTAQRRALSDRVSVALRRLFEQLGAWRAAQARRFVAQAVPLLEGAQLQLAALTAVYVTDQASRAVGRVLAPPGIPGAAAVDLRNGATAREVYQRPFTTVHTALSRGESLPRAVELGSTRLTQIAEMDLQTTYAHASRSAMQQLPPDARPSGWRRVLVGPENCAMCVVASTQRYRIENLNWIHPACVPSGRRVRASDVLAGTRRRYAGELTVLATAAGDQVTVTPNHPVLTDQGWVPAGQVGERDYLVRCTDVERVVGHSPHESHGPALIEDVWRAFTVMGELVRMPLTAEDFHGDGSDSEVDVVRPHGHFTAIRDVEHLKELSEHGLVDRQRGRSTLARFGGATTLVPARVSPSAGGVSGGDLFSSLFGSHSARSDAASFRRTTVFDTGFGEPAPHDSSGDAALMSDNVLGESAVDVVAPELFDRVVDVRRVDFAGHVHNFQTRSGWYVSDNHIVHNCDCRVDGIYGPDLGLVIEPDLLEAVHDAVQTLTGHADRGGRAPDYRKLLVSCTAEHGELGELLVRPLDRFTSPADI
jgi:hypothetical protein